MIHTSFALTAAALLLAAAPAVANAEEAGEFAHKGVAYSYTTEDKGGDKIIRGTAYAGRVPFELHVHKKTVTGTFNNRPVDFSFADVKKLGIAVDGASAK